MSGRRRKVRADRGSKELSGPDPSAAPDFVVTASGDVAPIPQGASGPYPTENPGAQYNGGSGGNGLAANVTDMRIMESTLRSPVGYVNYGSRQANGGWQTVNPYTGEPVPRKSPWWHIWIR